MSNPSSALRCPACQLQLCKSRAQAPHALLTEVKSDESARGRETHFNCQTCGVTLINSSDLGKPGWRHAPGAERPPKVAKEQHA